MPAAEAVPKRPAARARITQVVVLSWLIIGALTALYSWQDREETLARGEERAAVLASTLRSHVITVLESTGIAMQVAGELRLAGATEGDPIRRFAAAERARHGYLAALYVRIEDGTTIGTGDASATAALMAWAASKQPAPGKMLLGDVLPAADGGTAIIPLALPAPEGGQSPPGTVLAAIRADFADRWYRELRLPPGTTGMLRDGQGRILSRIPFGNEAVGNPPSGMPDAKSAVYAASRLDAFALQASVGIDRAAILAPWLARTWRHLAVAAMLFAATGWIGWLAWSRARGETAAVQRLVDSEEHHRTTLATLAEGVVTHGADGAILTWNDAALGILGLSADQLRGITPLDPRWRAVHEDGREFPGDQHPAMRALATGEPQLGVLMGIDDGSGKRRWLKVNAVPTRSAGVIDGVAVSFYDITAMRDATEAIIATNQSLEERVTSRTAALVRTSKELEELVYSMAHTMRAPLRHIGSFATLLAEDARDRLNTDDLELVRRINESAARQARLVDDLLKYTSGHQHKPVFAHIAMDAMVDAVIRDTRARSSDAGRVEWVRRPLPRLYGDPAMVSEILEILLSNAVKFSARSAAPRIEIGPCEIDGMPGVEISDNGAGFDMRYADKLFGMFQRLHEAEGYPGSGMDLAICRRLVQRQGGRISAHGEVGKGATFRFALGAGRPGQTPA